MNCPARGYYMARTGRIEIGTAGGPEFANQEMVSLQAFKLVDR
jgi:hypothetical protein